MKLTRTVSLFIAISVPSLLLLPACRDSLADCKNTSTCPPEGDGDGDGDSSTGGTGDGDDPSDPCLGPLPH